MFRHFEIVISDKYLKEYWLIIEANENTTLKELDEFIRDIWVECCEPEIFFPICNSPRMGVCGYDGSRIYSDQFEPDTELGEK